ncbi:hypothetical protein O7632_11840 [Solwaraspora sp. WMMD406]|nr:hypothetical protein [Solwaraspora sp. WMMD406]MDG4764790.1 hypothetical protein [Solwaraspora sp. WMMD406]
MAFEFEVRPELDQRQDVLTRLVGCQPSRICWIRSRRPRSAHGLHFAAKVAQQGTSTISVAGHGVGAAQHHRPYAHLMLLRQLP